MIVERTEERGKKEEEFSFRYELLRTQHRNAHQKRKKKYSASSMLMLLPYIRKKKKKLLLFVVDHHRSFLHSTVNVR